MLTSCDQFHNSNSTTILEPPRSGTNITTCAVNQFGNQTYVLQKCNGKSDFGTYENGCFAYVNLTSTAEDAQDKLIACLIENGVHQSICSTPPGSSQTVTNTVPTTTPTGSTSPSGRPNDAGAVGISKGAAALSFVLGFGVLIGMGF